MAENQEAKDITVNCAGCNKHLKKVKRYYRNGKYYCSKSCWESLSKKTQDKAAEAA